MAGPIPRGWGEYQRWLQTQNIVPSGYSGTRGDAGNKMTYDQRMQAAYSGMSDSSMPPPATESGPTERMAQLPSGWAPGDWGSGPRSTPTPTPTLWARDPTPPTPPYQSNIPPNPFSGGVSYNQSPTDYSQGGWGAYTPPSAPVYNPSAYGGFAAPSDLSRYSPSIEIRPGDNFQVPPAPQANEGGNMNLAGYEPAQTSYGGNDIAGFGGDMSIGSGLNYYDAGGGTIYVYDGDWNYLETRTAPPQNPQAPPSASPSGPPPPVNPFAGAVAGGSAPPVDPYGGSKNRAMGIYGAGGGLGLPSGFGGGVGALGGQTGTGSNTGFGGASTVGAGGYNWAGAGASTGWTVPLGGFGGNNAGRYMSEIQQAKIDDSGGGGGGSGGIDSRKIYK